MATQTIRVQAALPAGTYHVNVQVGGQNTDLFTNLSLVATSNPTFWTFNVASATAGLYSFYIADADDNVVAYGWFYSDTDAVVTIQDSNTADGAMAAARFSKLPQVGKTHRYTHTASGTSTVDVGIAAVP